MTKEACCSPYMCGPSQPRLSLLDTHPEHSICGPSLAMYNKVRKDSGKYLGVVLA